MVAHFSKSVHFSSYHKRILIVLVCYFSLEPTSQVVPNGDYFSNRSPLVIQNYAAIWMCIVHRKLTVEHTLPSSVVPHLNMQFLSCHTRWRRDRSWSLDSAKPWCTQLRKGAWKSWENLRNWTWKPWESLRNGTWETWEGFRKFLRIHMVGSLFRKVCISRALLRSTCKSYQVLMKYLGP